MKEVLRYPYKASIGKQDPFGGFFYSFRVVPKETLIIQRDGDVFQRSP